MKPIPLIGTMCAGIILALTCYGNFPALQPEFETLWGLTKTESGLIFGVFFGGVLAGTPILGPLADKIDPRRVWTASTLLMAASCFGFALFAKGFWSAALFRGMTGLGLAGVYMPGLKIVSDRLEGRAQARAAVVYTGSFIVGFAGSFAMTGEVAAAFGWQWAFAAAGFSRRCWCCRSRRPRPTTCGKRTRTSWTSGPRFGPGRPWRSSPPTVPTPGRRSPTARGPSLF
jgi:MFS family permease